tara:strand:- start:69 stop:395 length:327 start_codon:yes stop_codon:yes gene_type:complete
MSIQTIETMVTWLESNMTENPCLADMSKFVGYSPYYCSSKFHETLGIPFKTYLKRRKLCLTAQDLKKTKKELLILLSSMVLHPMRPLQDHLYMSMVTVQDNIGKKSLF